MGGFGRDRKVGHVQYSLVIDGGYALEVAVDKNAVNSAKIINLNSENVCKSKKSS